MAPPSLGNCPDHILVEIVNHVALQSGYQCRDYNDICSLSVVNKKCRSLAIEHIFRVIRLPAKTPMAYRPRPIQQALGHTRYLKAACDEQRAARREYQSDVASIVTILSQTSNLRTLATSFAPKAYDILRHTLDNEGVRLDTITELNLTALSKDALSRRRRNSGTNVFALLRYFPNLTALTGFGAHPTYTPEYLRQLKSNLRSTHLEHLQLDWPGNMYVAKALLKHWPRLSTLALAYNDETILLDEFVAFLTAHPTLIHISLPSLHRKPAQDEVVENPWQTWLDSTFTINALFERVPGLCHVAVRMPNMYAVYTAPGVFRRVSKVRPEGWRRYVEDRGEGEKVVWTEDGGLKRVQKHPFFDE